MPQRRKRPRARKPTHTVQQPIAYVHPASREVIRRRPLTNSELNTLIALQKQRDKINWELRMQEEILGLERKLRRAKVGDGMPVVSSGSVGRGVGSLEQKTETASKRQPRPRQTINVETQTAGLEPEKPKTYVKQTQTLKDTRVGSSQTGVVRTSSVGVSADIKANEPAAFRAPKGKKVVVQVDEAASAVPEPPKEEPAELVSAVGGRSRASQRSATSSKRSRIVTIDDGASIAATVIRENEEMGKHDKTNNVPSAASIERIRNARIQKHAAPPQEGLPKTVGLLTDPAIVSNQPRAAYYGTPPPSITETWETMSDLSDDSAAKRAPLSYNPRFWAPLSTIPTRRDEPSILSRQSGNGSSSSEKADFGPSSSESTSSSSYRSLVPASSSSSESSVGTFTGINVSGYAPVANEMVPVSSSDESSVGILPAEPPN